MLPKAEELMLVVDHVKLEACVTMVVLAFDIVTKDLAEVMIGGGMTVNG